MCWASSSPQQSYPLDRPSGLPHSPLAGRVELRPRPPRLVISDHLPPFISNGSDELADDLSPGSNRSVDRHHIRILIADDQPLIRIGLHTLLSCEQDLEVVGEVDRSDEVESAMATLAPDLLILDVRMLGLDALGATRQLIGRYPEVAILVLSACDDQGLIFGLLEAGVTGYALKEESPTSLLFAIRAVAGGQTWLSSRVARMLVSKAVATWGPPTVSQDLAALTEREQEVLALIGRGLSNQEIAEVLCIACGTVRSHIKRVYDKMDLGGRSQAMRYAMTHGLVSVPPEE